MSEVVGCHRSGLVEFIESRTGKEVEPFELSLAYGSFLFSWPSTTDCSNKEILGEQRCERRCERVKVCGFGVLWYVLKIVVFAWKSLVFGSNYILFGGVLGQKIVYMTFDIWIILDGGDTGWNTWLADVNIFYLCAVPACPGSKVRLLVVVSPVQVVVPLELFKEASSAVHVLFKINLMEVWCS